MKLSTKEMTVCALFASLTSVMSQISIPLPFTIVPFTMQLFAVALCGLILKPKLAFISQLIYILMGSIGIPVFSQFSGGIGIVLGPTGGYLWAFPIAVFIISYIIKKYDFIFTKIIAMTCGLISIYVLGTIQFSVVTGMTVIDSIYMAVAPFIILDIAKFYLAIVVAKPMKRAVYKEIYV